MNAHSPIGPAHGLTVAALNGEAILRAVLTIADPGAGEKLDRAAIAGASGRPAKNLGRELDQLVAAGLLSDGYRLTPAGAAALDALDRAARAGDTGAGDLRVPVSGLKPNPLNPRKRFDESDIEAMADTIFTDQDILEPLLVSPPDATGERTIWAGERRWRAARRLAAHGDLPEALKAGLPCRERAADPGEALWIAIVENSQRVDLTPWEDAQGLKALADAKGWSARQLAKAIGRAPADSETGVRDVQEKIKVASEASPEAIAAHEAGEITWEALRATIRERKPDAPKPDMPHNPHLALLLVEAALAAEGRHGVWDAHLTLRPNHAFMTDWLDGWFAYDGHSGLFILQDRATDWLARVGLGDDPDLTLNYYRMAAGHPAVANAVPPWASGALACLNPPAPSATSQASDEAAEPTLTGPELRVLVEVAHAAFHAEGRTEAPAAPGEFILRYAPAGQYWLDQVASNLQQKRLIGFKHQGRPFVFVTVAGADWLANQGYHPDLGQAFLDRVWAETSASPAEGQPYVTTWLNPQPAPEAAKIPDADDDADDDDAADDAAAAQLLDEGKALLADPAGNEPQAIRKVLEATGLTLPLLAMPDQAGAAFDATGRVAFVVDVDGDLHDDVATARVIGLIAAVHAACGVTVEGGDA